MDMADLMIMTGMFFGATLPVGFGVAWYQNRQRVRELEARLRGTDDTSESRIEAVERSVEALADQMEQLASGQEFLNRLLTKQLERMPSAPPPPSAITPH